MSRRIDRWLHTRSGILGWEFYFGKRVESVDATAWVNVCVRCGSGSPSSFLRAEGSIRSVFPGIRVYRCPHCGGTNPFINDSNGRFPTAAQGGKAYAADR